MAEAPGPSPTQMPPLSAVQWKNLMPAIQDTFNCQVAKLKKIKMGDEINSDYLYSNPVRPHSYHPNMYLNIKYDQQDFYVLFHILNL
jgi:hypothetical protein